VTRAVGIAYDGDGNRVSESIGGTTTKFLVDDHNPTGLPQVLDEIVSGAVTRTYAYGRQRISENQLISGTWTPSFYGYDGHGNVRFLTNSSGVVTDSYDYDAFGMPIKTSGTTANAFLYSGERLDSNIGLYDLRARYLNHATGRFWSRDPIEGKKCCGLSWNPYIYVKQNPVNAIDPTGREALINWMIANQKPLVYGAVALLGTAIVADYICEGHEAQSAVPGPQPQPIPPATAFWGAPSSPGASNGSPNGPCSLPHLGLGVRLPPGSPEFLAWEGELPVVFFIHIIRRGFVLAAQSSVILSELRQFLPTVVLH
jgi:RHS repeat-associated protein